MAVQIQFKRDTGSNWSTANTVLAEGELGINTTTNQFKIGNGSTAWNSLSYAPISGTVADIDDITNVVITSAADGQILKYNGTNWVNVTFNELIALTGLSDVTITSAATSDIVKWDGTAFVNVAMNNTYTSSLTTTAATANAVRLAHRDAILNFTMEVI